VGITLMQFLLALLLLALSSGGAAAQNFGNINPLSVIGNPDPATKKPAAPMPIADLFDHGITLSGPIGGIGNIGGGVAWPPLTTAQCATGWNMSGGGGETDWNCEKGIGSVGGFWFLDNNGGSPKKIAELSVSRGLVVPTFINSSGTGPPMTAKGTGGISAHRGSNSLFDTALSGTCYVDDPITPNPPTLPMGAGCFGIYAETRAYHGVGAPGSIPKGGGVVSELTAFNFTSVNAATGVRTPNTGYPSEGDLPEDVNARFHVDGLQVTCTDPDGYGCSVGIKANPGGPYPAPWITGFYVPPGSATANGMVIDATAAAGPANALKVKNAGNLWYALSISGNPNAGTGYTVGCSISLVDANRIVPTVIVVDTIGAGGSIGLSHIAIPGTTTSAPPANPLSSGSPHNCSGSGATFTMNYAFGVPLDIQYMAPTATVPAIRVKDSAGADKFRVLPAGDLEVRGSAGVNCGAGLSATTARVVGGVVTAC
jgi:hypothetical protein